MITKNAFRSTLQKLLLGVPNKGVVGRANSTESLVSAKLTELRWNDMVAVAATGIDGRSEVDAFDFVGGHVFGTSVDADSELR
jgi:hypothetical protein